jgi:DNA repair exonuclease SbcCD ATPase subunit
MPKSKSPSSNAFSIYFLASPITPPRGRDATEKNKKALCRNNFSLFLRQVICPSGSCREFVSSPRRKNKSLRDLLKSDL